MVFYICINTFLIEKVFIKLGIYEIYWYKTYYTFFGFIFLSWVIKWWYIKVINQKQYVFRYIELLLGIYAVYSPTINWVFELLRIQYFIPGFTFHPIRDHILGYFIYSFFSINIMINLYRLKVRWLWKMLVFIALYLVQVALVNLNLLYIKEGWFFVCTTIDFLGYYFLVFVIDNFSKSS